MNNEENLVGRIVTIYLSGGWEVTGYVESVSDKKIVIKDLETSELYLSFMSKVSCLKINSENKEARRGPEGPSPKFSYGVSGSSRPNRYEDMRDFPMNKMAYDDSVMSIPQGLLKGAPDEDTDDFSVSFGSNQGLSEREGLGGGIEFRLKNDSKKED